VPAAAAAVEPTSTWCAFHSRSPRNAIAAAAHRIQISCLVVIYCAITTGSVQLPPLPMKLQLQATTGSAGEEVRVSFL